MSERASVKRQAESFFKMTRLAVAGAMGETGDGGRYRRKTCHRPPYDVTTLVRGTALSTLSSPALVTVHDNGSIDNAEKSTRHDGGNASKPRKFTDPNGGGRDAEQLVGPNAPQGSDNRDDPPPSRALAAVQVFESGIPLEGI